MPKPAVEREKRWAPQHLQVKQVDRENYRIYFVFSTGAVDRHGEVIDQKGWKLDNYLKNPVVLWGHDQSKFPIGRAEELGVIDDALQGWVRFAYTQNPEAAMAFELIADDFLNAGSVGFMNDKWMYSEEDDLLTLLENELFEFSIVNVPANPEALAKAHDRLKEKGVDKRTLAGIEELRKSAEKAQEDRFKGLGMEVKADATEDGDGQYPDAEEVAARQGEDEEVTPEPEGEEVETETATAEETEEAKAHIEALCKMSPSVIKGAVAELSTKLEGANTPVETTPAMGRGKKSLTKSKLNRMIRTLSQARS